MGMIYDEKTGKYKILSDIQAQEDFLGDMDFKVTMSPNGITAMQLDVKIAGLKMEVFENAFTQARASIDNILENMKKVIPEKKELSPKAPRIEAISVPVDKIREVIGKGGETIQKIEKECEVKIHIEEDGSTFVTGKNASLVHKALETVAQIIWEPNVGEKHT